MTEVLEREILEKNNEIKETINPDNLNTISTHSKILQTSDNIYITFKKSKIRIKLQIFAKNKFAIK